MALRFPKPAKRIPTVSDPKWTGNFRDDPVQILLARMIFGEARQSTLSDMARIAVGCVARNRVLSGKWGKTYVDVLLARSQFSCFSKRDPNRRLVENPFVTKNLLNQKAWLLCYSIAGKILTGNVTDPTRGALYYHSGSIVPPSFKKLRFLIQIDSFRFYI